MNKQEAIEQLKNKVLHHCGEKECYKDGCEKHVELNTALDIINQIEPQKVVIPKFIARYLHASKHQEYSLYISIDESLMEYVKDVSEWMVKEKNQETFMRAWLDGYEIEKEQLYVINLGCKVGLSIYLRDIDKKLYPNGGDWATTGGIGFARKFTEPEIKEDFAWAWQFAEKVA